MISQGAREPQRVFLLACSQLLHGFQSELAAIRYAYGGFLAMIDTIVGRHIDEIRSRELRQCLGDLDAEEECYVTD